MSRLKRLLPARATNLAGTPAPTQPFYAIGDVHGRLDLLEPQLNGLMQQTDPIVLVGDYVDRGDGSAGVLRLLHRATMTGQVICLRGNHEEMMLKFIDKPQKNGRIWLRHGGLQTLASFGIGEISEQAEPDALREARNRLVVELGDTQDWLRALPYIWQSGNVAVVHAGADPALPLNAQPERALVWGHTDFLSKPRSDGCWVIYGHTAYDCPLIENGRAGIDTGAYASGRLTAVHVTAGAITPL